MTCRICAKLAALTICRHCCLSGSKTKWSQLTQSLLSTTSSLFLVSCSRFCFHVID